MAKLEWNLGLGMLMLAAMGMMAAVCQASEAGGAAPLPSTPLTLDQCTSIALQNSPQIISSEQALTGARAALIRARSSYYPQLSLSGTEAISGGGLGGSDGTDRTEEVGLSLRQTLWRSGLRQSVEESEARLQSAELSYTTAVQGLVEQVASDYYGVLAANRLVQVGEAGVDSAKGHLEQVQARIELGAAPEVDQFTAEYDLARAELDLIDAQTSHRITLARLKTTMGAPVETALELADPSALPGAEAPNLPEALAVAREDRPEILGARAQAAASRSALAQAEISRGPVIELGGGYDRGYMDWVGREPSWDVSLALSWPLYDGQARAAEVASARASLVRSEAELQQTINQTGLEVESALAEAGRAAARMTVSARSVAAADARLRAAEGKYQEGVGILLEVTDARVALTSALANQIQAEYDYRVTRVSLERVLGRLSAPSEDKQ